MSKIGMQEVVDIFNDLYELEAVARMGGDTEIFELAHRAKHAVEEITWILEERDEQSNVAD